MKQNPQLIRRAIVAHFACNKLTLHCDQKLESFISIAQDFQNFFLTGTRTDTFEKSMQTNRYRIKKELVKRYIKNNS